VLCRWQSSWYVDDTFKHHELVHVNVTNSIILMSRTPSSMYNKLYDLYITNYIIYILQTELSNCHELYQVSVTNYIIHVSRTLWSTHHQLYLHIANSIIKLSRILSSKYHELYHLNITHSHCRCGRSLRTWFATTLALLLSPMSSTLPQVLVIYVNVCIHIYV